MKKVQEIKSELKKLANPETKKVLQSFFKTGPGEYAEGDVFLGVKVPQIRETIKKHHNLSLKDLDTLIKDKIHEFRFASLAILCEQYKKENEKRKKEIYNFYLDHTKNINNWDLVDISAPKIIGSHLGDKDRKILYKLASSENIWERRIAIVSTYSFIKHNDFFDTLTISELLLKDEHDLIQKAVGWMLRELGKKDEIMLKKFLNKFKNEMPRTMLRYAIEKLSKEDRKKYLAK